MESRDGFAILLPVRGHHTSTGESGAYYDYYYYEREQLPENGVCLRVSLPANAGRTHY